MKHSKRQDKQWTKGEHNPELKWGEPRAYKLYLDRVSDAGHDIDEWRRAEPQSEKPGAAEPGTISP